MAFMRSPVRSRAAGLKDAINASRHGQLALRDLIGMHLQRVEWNKDGFVARLYPFAHSRRSPAEEAEDYGEDPLNMLSDGGVGDVCFPK